jgi:predicted ester cyclase
MSQTTRKPATKRSRNETFGNGTAKGIVTRLVDEVINGGNTRLLPDLLDPEHVTHDPTGDLYGPEGMRIDIAGYRTAFPDLRMTTEDLVADGDRVARRFRLEGTHAGSFMGIPPSGQRVALGGIAIHRFDSGRLVETWLSYDCLGLLRQLDAADARVASEGSAAD